MKRNPMSTMLALCAVLGVLRIVDLCLFTDSATGFSTLGSAWLRYSIVAVYMLFVHVFFVLKKPCMAKEDGVNLPMQPLYAAACAPAVCCGVLYGVAGVAQFQTPSALLSYALPAVRTALLLLYFITAASLICFAVFSMLLARLAVPLTPQVKGVRVFGFAGVVGFGIASVLHYYELPTSLHRIVYVLPVFYTLILLLFVGKVLGLLCKPCTLAYANTLAELGVFAFLFGTCFAGPQVLWQLMQGTASILSLCMAVLATIIGVAGGASAMSLCAE